MKKNEFEVNGRWRYNVWERLKKNNKKNSLSDSYLQMFAGVIEQVNFLSASLAYQLLTSTDWGYLTFIVRRARY